MRGLINASVFAASLMAFTLPAQAQEAKPEAPGAAAGVGKAICGNAVLKTGVSMAASFLTAGFGGGGGNMMGKACEIAQKPDAAASAAAPTAGAKGAKAGGIDKVQLSPRELAMRERQAKGTQTTSTSAKPTATAPETAPAAQPSAVDSMKEGAAKIGSGVASVGAGIGTGLLNMGSKLDEMRKAQAARDAADPEAAAKAEAARQSRYNQ